MERVAEDVRARVDLGVARVRTRQVPGAEAAAGDDLGGEAVAVELVDDLDQGVVRRPALLDPHGPVGLEHAVPLVAEDAAQAQARQPLDQPAEVDRLGHGANARAVQAHVELDEDADLGPGIAGGCRDLLGVRRALDGDDHFGEAAEPGELGGLVRADRLIGDQELREAGVDHRARLPDRRRREADRSRVELHAAEHRALVDLGVRPQARRQRVHAPPHLGDVLLDERQVEDQRRRRRCVARAADEPARDLETRISVSHGARGQGGAGARPWSPSAPRRPPPPSPASSPRRATGARAARRFPR